MTQTHDFLGKKWVEITVKEYRVAVDRVSCWCNDEKRWRYFKLAPEPKFPKVFEDEDFRFGIEDKMINICLKDYPKFDIFIGKSFPLLKQAVEYAEKHWDNGGKGE